jgi:hypothetical protein
MTPFRKRVLLTIALAAAAGTYVLAHRWRAFDKASDLLQVRLGAQAWLQGLDPYRVVRDSGAWPYPLLYPLPALIAASPLVLVPAWLAEAAFMAAGTALLAWGVTRERLVTPALVVFASAPFLYAVALSQWSPLLTGAALVPWAGWLLVCKPTIGLALFAAFPRVSTAAGVAFLVALSVILWPGWVHEWRLALAHAPNAIAPLTLPGGPLLLLALARWKRPEARLLAALACVPHTTLAYEAVPLFLVPRTWGEAWVLCGGTFAAFIGHGLTGPYSSQFAWVRAGGIWLIACAYLPCLVMVLRRPNELQAGDAGSRARMPGTNPPVPARADR